MMNTRRSNLDGTLRPLKSWLIIKRQHLEEATHLFKDSQVNITDDGRKHFGAAVGSNTFKESYLTNKVEEWVRQLVYRTDTILKTLHFFLLVILSIKKRGFYSTIAQIKTLSNS